MSAPSALGAVPGAAGLAVGAFVPAAAASLAASWLLVSRLERVGKRLGLSEALLGLLAALGADAPEITAAVTALARHQRAVGTSVVTGSNVFNLAALLGVSALVAGRIDLHRRVVVLGGAVAAWAAAMAVVCVTGLVPPAAVLGLLLLVLVPYVAVLAVRRGTLARWGLPTPWVRWLGLAVVEEEAELVVAIHPRRGGGRDVATAAVAVAAVVVASVVMERAATALGGRAVPGVVLGGLVLAVVTSLPNAVAAVYLAARGRGAATLSTALNSNTVNVVAGLVLPATVVGVRAARGPDVLCAASFAGLTALALVLAYAGRGLRRPAGWVISAGYGAFAVALVVATL